MCKSDISDSDFLDEIVEERLCRDPLFSALVDQAYERRLLLRRLADLRKAESLSPTTVAARLGTSEAALARLESASVDPSASTIERFDAALGKHVRYQTVDAD